MNIIMKKLANGYLFNQSIWTNIDWCVELRNRFRVLVWYDYIVVTKLGFAYTVRVVRNVSSIDAKYDANSKW